MRSNERSLGFIVALAVFTITVSAPGTRAFAQEKALYSFTGGSDGAGPEAGVIFDAAGNLYGTADTGGATSTLCPVGCGTVFELKHSKNGWTQTALYSFGGTPDGAFPLAGLILDSSGSLYGTTYLGGTHGFGTVFRLMPSGSGWTETLLYSFTGGNDGGRPSAGLIFDSKGNLYGTTQQGGTGGSGVVFELTPSGGRWGERVLYSFTGGSDGSGPRVGLTLHASKLYGTTYVGGTGGFGVVFELKHLNGAWVETAIYNFSGNTDGGYPLGGVVFDAAGNLYGTTSLGGDLGCPRGSGCGTVFELKPSGGTWTESALYSFTGGGDGDFPQAGLILRSGSLYGTTQSGGSSGSGAVFELIPSVGGWTESVLYSFTGGSDGKFPLAGLVLGSGGLYGTTYGGGTGGHGVVFEVTQTEWKEFGFTPAGGRDNINESVLNTSNASNLALTWSYPTGYFVTSSPAVVDGVVYVGAEDYSVYALSASTGAKLWQFTTGSYVYSSPAVANGVVYVGSADGNVYAMNASTGAELWQFSTGFIAPYVYSSPAVANGMVYVGADNAYSGEANYVLAVDATTGAYRWTFTAGSSVDSSPAVANGVVYVGSADNNVYALNASTGAKLWQFTTGGAVTSSPAVVNGVVYVGSADNNVYALNASTGAKVWQFTTGGAVDSSPAVANGVVYVGSWDNNIYALSARAGAKLWQFTTGYVVNPSPAVANGVVYIGSWDDNVYALNANTGSKLWQFTTANAASSPVVADGVVYVGSWDHNVYAFSVPKNLAQVPRESGR
jgi:uncharacterized repeat protein (TIGR03803 family)